MMTAALVQVVEGRPMMMMTEASARAVQTHQTALSVASNSSVCSPC